MGLFDFLKKKRPSAEEQALVDSIAKSLDAIANAPLPKPLSAEEYSQMRQREMDWLEKHYDFNSLAGINANFSWIGV